MVDIGICFFLNHSVVRASTRLKTGNYRVTSVVTRHSFASTSGIINKIGSHENNILAHRFAFRESGFCN